VATPVSERVHTNERTGHGGIRGIAVLCNLHHDAIHLQSISRSLIFWDILNDDNVAGLLFVHVG
jgi:hypothetical protein